MKIKKVKKALEAEILEFIKGREEEFKTATEVGFKSVTINMGSSHNSEGEVIPHVNNVKIKLDI